MKLLACALIATTALLAGCGETVVVKSPEPTDEPTDPTDPEPTTTTTTDEPTDESDWSSDFRDEFQGLCLRVDQRTGEPYLGESGCECVVSTIEDGYSMSDIRSSSTGTGYVRFIEDAIFDCLLAA